MLYLASDHGGFEFKEKIKTYLTQQGISFQDMGAHEFDKDDDYPDFARRAAEKVSEDPHQNLAILLCRSGAGVAIVANKFKGVYCAQVWSKKTAQKACEHDQVNAIAIASDYIEEDHVLPTVDSFLSAKGKKVESAERHLRRFGKIQEIETKQFKESIRGIRRV